MKRQGITGILPVALAIGTCSSVVLAADSCITGGWPVASAAAKSGVSPAVALAVPQPVASAPLAMPLEARTRVATVSSGTGFSSHAAGGVIIVR